MMHDEQSVERIVEHALGLVSPAYAIQSKAIQLSFRKFFARGTLPEWEQLLPEGHQLLPSPALPPTKAAISAGLESDPATTSSDPAAYFTKEGVLPEKAELLSRVVDGLQNAKHHDNEEYDKLWNGKSPTFESNSNDTFERLQNLFQGIKKLEDDRSLVDCGIRLSLLFLLHDMDHIEATVTKADVSRGRGKRTIAKDRVAEKCNIERERLSELLKRTKTYWLVAQNLGLGSLLELGGTPTIWEGLLVDEVNLICKYYEEHLLHIKARSQTLGITAATTIIAGLKAYGWQDDELSRGQSELMILVGKHINLKELAHGNIRALSASTSGAEPHENERRRDRKKRRITSATTGSAFAARENGQGNVRSDSREYDTLGVEGGARGTSRQSQRTGPKRANDIGGTVVSGHRTEQRLAILTSEEPVTQEQRTPSILGTFETSREAVPNMVTSSPSGTYVDLQSGVYAHQMDDTIHGFERVARDLTPRLPPILNSVDGLINVSQATISSSPPLARTPLAARRAAHQGMQSFAETESTYTPTEGGRENVYSSFQEVSQGSYASTSQNTPLGLPRSEASELFSYAQYIAEDIDDADLVLLGIPGDSSEPLGP